MSMDVPDDLSGIEDLGISAEDANKKAILGGLEFVPNFGHTMAFSFIVMIVSTEGSSKSSHTHLAAAWKSFNDTAEDAERFGIDMLVTLFVAPLTSGMDFEKPIPMYPLVMKEIVKGESA